MPPNKEYIGQPDPHSPEFIEWRYFDDGSVWPYEKGTDRIFPTTIGITGERLAVISSLQQVGYMLWGDPGGIREPRGLLHANTQSVPIEDAPQGFRDMFTKRVRELLEGDWP